ncbi:hypothetical protein BJ322DRAFT_158918 [Thelephora terrestris]|uniref:Zn(2)-C6 fungal-type domain-containing protein n=1 Tax=Thelephora terrestris TaxID=56493 RepID=A0A9P6L5X9_9AGAM|nr:hypothetical protein BJ322DRAFT_158918 [Thelephora terrestris]
MLPLVFVTTSFPGTTSSVTRRACAACRAVKVRCIQGTPRCARCTDMGIEDCRYDPVKKRGIGNTLRTGGACIPCRRKKTRCDAKHPCTTCVNRDRGAGCVYKKTRSSDNVPPRPQKSPPRDAPFLASSDPSGSGSSYFRHYGLLERSSTPAEQPALDVCLQMVPVPPLNPTVAEQVFGATEYPPPPTLPPLTTLPSIRFQAVPRPLSLPLSVIPPERLQVSNASGCGLDMAFRLKALCQLNKLGLYFTPEKQEAILRGDTSDSVVHHFFVNAAHAMGMHFCAPAQTPAMVRLQARYIQMAWESIVSLNKTNQERDKAQALILVAHSFLILGTSAGAQLYLMKACKIIEKAKLQFLSESGLPVAFSEQVREEASVLSQAIFLENYIQLALDGLAPVKTARIEREFRSDLEGVYPCLFVICPLTMRTQSVLLVRDAVHALNSVDQGENTGERQRSCHHIVYALDTFSSDLMRNLEYFSSIGDTNDVETIWTCCVICLAHLAALCHFMSQTDTTSSLFMNHLYDLTLEKLCNLSLKVHIESYSPFDVLTGKSWNTALDTIDARLGLCSDAEKGSLRNWKAVIEKAYEDFRANLPGFEPTSFDSLVLATDGRSENSSFPNLSEPKERERYGL